MGGGCFVDLSRQCLGQNPREGALGDAGLHPSPESPHLGHQGLLTLAWSSTSVAHIPPAQGLGPGTLTFSLVSPPFLEERVGRTHQTGLLPSSLPTSHP